MAVFVVGGVAMSADQIAWMEAESVTQTKVRFDGAGWVVVAATLDSTQAAWEADISAPSVFAVGGIALNADRITWMEAEGITQARVLFGGTGQIVVPDTLANVQAAWEAAITPAPEPAEPEPRYSRSVWWQTTTAGGVTGVGGIAPTVVGAVSTPILAATNGRTLARRTQITSGATAGSMASMRSTQAVELHTSTGGGWRTQTTFALNAVQTGNRAFIGVVDEVAVPTNIDPLTSGVRGRVGLACKTSSGAWSIVHTAGGGVAPTVIALSASGQPIDTTTLYTLTMTAAAGSIVVELQNLSTGVVVSHTLSTNIPAAATLLASAYWVCNNATAASVGLDFVMARMDNGLLTEP